MSLRSKIEFEPVRTLSATLAFGAAVLVGLQYKMAWSGEAVVLISGIWNGLIALVGTLFVRNQVTPNSKVDQTVTDRLAELAQLIPQNEKAADDNI